MEKSGVTVKNVQNGLHVQILVASLYAEDTNDNYLHFKYNKIHCS